MKNAIRFMLFVCMFGTVMAAGHGDKTCCDSEVRIKKFPIAMQCWTFRKFSFLETLDKVQELGIHYLEAYPGQKLIPDADDPDRFDTNLSDDQIAWVQSELKKRDISLVSFGVVNFDNTERDAETVFEFSKKLGIRTIVTEPAFDDYTIIEKMVQKYDIRVAIHNHPPPTKYWDPETVLSHIRGLDPRIGDCADTGHWTRSGICPVSALKKLSGRIRNVHLKDLNDFGNPDAFDVPFGQGKSNIEGVLAELTMQDYDGFLAIEHEKKEDEMNPSPPVAEGLKYLKRITYYQDYDQLLGRDNGLYHKHGWNQYGPGYFILDERTGVLKGQGGMGLFWYSTRKFRDFVLELDFMCDDHVTNSGVFLRIPELVASNDYIAQCYEIQIDNASRGIHQTGAVYDALAPSSLAFHEPGQWNHYKITYKSMHLFVELNGIKIVDWETVPRGKVRSLSKEGYIGLQNHDSRAPVYFKNIYIKSL